MDNTTEALKLALEALDLAQALLEKSNHHVKILDAYTAIKEALAQPAQQEPVAFDVWLQECESMTMAVQHGVKFLLMPEESAVRIGTAIQNTTQPQRKPLTVEEIDAIDEANWDADHKSWGIHDFARAIEDAHNIKEKNT